MFVAKVDANGQVVIGPDGRPIMIEVPDGLQPGVKYGALLTPEQAEAQARERAAAARAEEKTKLYADLERERSDRVRLQEDLERRDKAERERQLAALPADQQTSARMTEMERQLAQEKAARVQLETASRDRDRAMQLTLYRERAARDVPPEAADLVFGNSEQEIDASVDRIRTIHSGIEGRLRAQFQRGVGAPPYGSVQQVPPNPSYVAPQPWQAQGGLPTYVQPLPVTPDESQPTVTDMRSMTTEEAVRSGRYGGEMRERLHAQIRGTPYRGNLGSAPRHWQGGPTPAPAVQGPLGTQVPQGHPNANPNPPQYQPAPQFQQQPPPQGQYQPPPGYVLTPVQPQYQPQQQYAPRPQYPQQYAPQLQYQPQPAPGFDPGRAAAEQAVARMHAGQSPIVQGDPSMANALSDAHAHAGANGIPGSRAAFHQRFQPTPPIQ